MHVRGFQRLEGASSFVTLGCVIICNFKFKRTENHNFTVTTNTSQYMEFFHSLIFFYLERLVQNKKGFFAIKSEGNISVHVLILCMGSYFKIICYTTVQCLHMHVVT